MARGKKSKAKSKKTPAAIAQSNVHGKQPASVIAEQSEPLLPSSSQSTVPDTANAATAVPSYGSISHSNSGAAPRQAEAGKPLPVRAEKTLDSSGDIAEDGGNHSGQAAASTNGGAENEGCSSNQGMSPCIRCQHIISHAHNDSSSSSLASSITKAEAMLVPRFVAAQMDEQGLKDVSQRQGAKVASFYESQNELIAELLGVNQQHTDDVLELQSEQRKRKQRQVDMAVRVSVFVNVLVVLAQLYAAISSKSLSLFATMSEAMMDLLSSIILLLASMAARRRDRFSLYPSGRYKLETIGVIVFAVLMGTFSVALLAESISALLSADHAPNNLSLYDAACVIMALLAKVGLFFYCYTLREYHAAHVLMIDHRNDVFVNAFGLTMAIVGKHLMPWMDPMGSLIIALMILKSWIEEAWDQIKLIVGISADPHLLQVLTYTALTHDPRIEKVDRVVAYHSGAKLFVEVDIVMPPATPLVMLHDVAESLQEKYERMPGVGRCHVHVDYEVTHRSEHQNAEA